MTTRAHVPRALATLLCAPPHTAAACAPRVSAAAARCAALRRCAVAHAAPGRGMRVAAAHDAASAAAPAGVAPPPPAAVTIRRARLEDGPRLVALVNESYRGDGNWTHEKGLVVGPRVTPEDVARILGEQVAARPDGSPPPSIVLLAELPGTTDGSFVGCIEVTTTDAAASVAAPHHPPRDGYLGMLAVAPQFGSRGIGRALVAEGERVSREVYGAAAVVLFVLSVRADILSWYERRGYARTGLRVEAASLIASIQQDAKLLVDADFLVLRRVL